jgi:HEAT repeat protein
MDLIKMTEPVFERNETRKSDLEDLILEAMRAVDERSIPQDLLARLARRQKETLQHCIERLADPNVSRWEEASLARLLQRTGWIQKFVDSLLFAPPRTAAAAAGALQRTERGLDVKLSTHLQSDDPGVVMRSLELIEVVGKSKQLVPVLFGLLGHEDPRIQSKAALVVEKLDLDFLYTRQLLRHSDARVRANALQSIADRADPRTAQFLRQGAGDADHRVRSLAAVGLCRLGDQLGWQILSRMIRDPRSVERCSAAWALGRCGTIESLPGLQSIALNDVDQRVRELAVQSIQRIRARTDLPHTSHSQ